MFLCAETTEVDSTGPDLCQWDRQ